MANYKKTKMGQLPGDKPVQAKAAMLEGKPFAADEDCAKAFKREHVRRANRRLRRKPIEDA